MNQNTTENLKKLVEKGESQALEFKINSENIGKDICAFANTNNGIILVGVNDKVNVIGVEDKKIEEEIANIAHSCDPPIRVAINKTDNILVVKVKKSNKIHSFKGIVYIRVGSTNKPLSMHEVLELGHKLGKIQFDSQICEEATLEDIDKEKVKAYLNLREKNRNISARIRIPLPKLLSNLKAITKNKPTNAGILFFGKYPQKFFHNAKLRAVRFRGTSIINPTINTLNCEGTLWEIVTQAEDFIIKNIKLIGTRTEESFRREDKFEYPIRALREAIINALIHRNYLTTGDVRVFIFDDRIEIINPGSFPTGITPDNPKHKPVNEILCDLMYDIGFIEKYGSGIYMMNELSKKWGNKKPYYELHPVETKIVFESPIKESTFIEIDESMASQLNERQKQFLKSGITNISRKEYSKLFKCSIRTAFNDLRELFDRKIVKKMGGGKYVCYTTK